MDAVLVNSMSSKLLRAPVLISSEYDIASVRDICGELKVLTEAKDYPPANVVTVEMRRPSTPHYHRKTTEFYYCVNGGGKLVVEGKLFNFLPGTVVMIPPYNAHFAVPGVLGMKVLVLSSPAWSKEDEFLTDRKKPVAGYSESVEKAVLIQQLLVSIRRGPLNCIRESRRLDKLAKLSVEQLRDLFRTAV